MKKTSQVLLTALFPVAQNKPGIVLTTKQLRFLVPDLSESGFKSLLYLLEQQELVNRELGDAEPVYSLTNLGKRAVEDEFPALSNRYDSWEGDWALLVFLTAPKGDPQFRYLRSLLLSQGAVALNRGVYLGAGGFSNRVMVELENEYRRSVVLLTVGEWQIGSEKPIVMKSLGLNDIVANYSGIGKQLARLLQEKLEKSSLKNQTKQDSLILFQQFLSVLQEDPGFTTRYIARSTPPLSLLAELQHIFQL